LLPSLISGLGSYSSQSTIDAAGRELLKVARPLWVSRQVELLDQVVQSILALPLNAKLHGVAKYYAALALGTPGHFEQSRILLERLIDEVPSEYKARPLLGIASCYNAAYVVDQSSKLYIEAARLATGVDPFAKCQALRGLALVRSFEGDHAGSLADLERLFPVMGSFATSYPEDYRYYLNNLAYELGQVGRIEEARAAINVALRSPYADRFPDWKETAQEIETMQRRVFLPLVFALGVPASLGVPAGGKAAQVLTVPGVTGSAAVAATPRAQVQAEASAVAQPESQPDIQTSPARVVAPTHRRNFKTSILLIVLARVTCRRVAQGAPLRETLKPTFQTSGCARSPSARAPPYLSFLF